MAMIRNISIALSNSGYMIVSVVMAGGLGIVALLVLFYGSYFRRVFKKTAMFSAGERC